MRFNVIVNYHKVSGGLIQVDDVVAPTEQDVIDAAGEKGLDEYVHGDCCLTIDDSKNVSFFSPLFGQYYLTNVEPGDSVAFEVVKTVIRNGQERLAKIVGEPATALFVENPA